MTTYRQMGHELHGGGGHGRGSHRDEVAQVATGAGPHKKGDGQAVEDGRGSGRDREQQGNGAGDGGKDHGGGIAGIPGELFVFHTD
jgi:hypothetical protein